MQDSKHVSAPVDVSSKLKIASSDDFVSFKNNISQQLEAYPFVLDLTYHLELGI